MQSVHVPKSGHPEQATAFNREYVSPYASPLLSSVLVIGRCTGPIATKATPCTRMREPADVNGRRRTYVFVCIYVCGLNPVQPVHRLISATL